MRFTVILGIEHHPANRWILSHHHHILGMLPTTAASAWIQISSQKNVLGRNEPTRQSNVENPNKPDSSNPEPR